jgi:exosortase
MLAGSAVMAKVWLGIAYLVFMIPLPWSTMKLITYRSRLFDAAISTEVASWLGVPVYRDGVMLHLPNIVLEVADACSSIPAIAALTSLGVAYATLAPRRLASRVTLIVATLPFAIMSNIIRLITTVAGVYYIGPVTLESLYHQFNGTVNFLLTFFLLLALDSWLVRFERKEVR